jgi:hypothetical protein
LTAGFAAGLASAALALELTLALAWEPAAV